MGIEQRNVTRNQSTADYSVGKIFIWDNHYVPGVFKNTTGAEMVIKDGSLLARSASVPNGFIAVTDANVADVVGVAKVEGSVTLAINGELYINSCTKGTIDGNLINLPANVTLNTIADGKALRDILESIGLHVDTSAVENTKFDN